MIKRYLTAFARNFRKDKVYSIINLLGFTVGITSFLLILLFVIHELSYDRYHANSDRIYRLCIKALIGDTRINQTFSSSRNFREMTARFPEIETGTKFLTWDYATVKYDDRIFAEKNIFFADSTIFDVFTLPLVYGTRLNALNRPNAMVISESCSRKYFGEGNPVGKVLRFELEATRTVDFDIAGVFRDIPYTSHMHYNMLGSLVSFPEYINSDGWSNNNFVTYFLLHPNTSVKILEEKMLAYTKETFGADQYEKWAAQGNYWEFFLQKLTDIHLKSDLNGEFEANGNIRNIYIFSVIGFFVLIIACINFMNLATARSARRAREVGIRKVAGSSRSLLVFQFLLESFILTLGSVLIALLLAKLLLPWFNNWLGLHLDFGLIGSGWLVLMVAGGTLLIGILAGLYPAFFLSAYRPVNVLKSQSGQLKAKVGIRNLLVIFQFTATVFLIIGTLMVRRQMQFLRNTDLGFVKEDVLVITSQPSFESHYESFRQEIMKNILVKNVTATRTLPGYPFANIGFQAENVAQSFTLNVYLSDENLDDVLGLRMAMGRFFSREFPTDTAGAVLNQTAVRVLGMKNPLGTAVFTNSEPEIKYRIIGVVEDFNYESMHSEVRPMAIFHRAGPRAWPMAYVAVKYKEGSRSEVTDLARNLWNRILPGTPFLYAYLDDEYEGLYRNDKQTAQVFAFLAILAILVACLGLLGLAAFLTQQQTRQIAIRKVFGASVRRIVNLLTYKFIRWVFLAILIACPMAWWVMTAWLRNFVYKAGLAWWIFALSGFIALAIAIITVSFVTFRAARANPAQSLKYE